MIHLPEAVQLHNIVDQAPYLESGPDTFLRIPKELRIQLNSSAKQSAFHSAGCELRFRLKGPSFKLRIETCGIGAPQHGGGLAQLVVGDFSHTYFPVGLGVTKLECTLPEHGHLSLVSESPYFHPELIRVLLPTHAAICGIEIDGDLSAPLPGDVPKRRVLHYGSSITQGSGSLTSRESWAGINARNLEADLINLGFGGGCHCEPAMTDYLCSRDDFDMAVIETGINMERLEPELANSNIQNLIKKFTMAHPKKPVFFVGVFPSHNDVTNNYAGRMQEFRELVRNEIEALDAPHAYFIEGRNALDPRTGLTTDLTHPSPAGMIQIGEFVSAEIKRLS